MKAYISDDLTRFRGHAAIEAIAQNWERIPVYVEGRPVEENLGAKGFYPAKLKLERHFYGDAPDAPFALARANWPKLQDLYTRTAALPLSDAFTYFLAIYPPPAAHSVELLRFKGCVRKVDRQSVYIAMYHPQDDLTQAVIDEQYLTVIERPGTNYVVSLVLGPKEGVGYSQTLSPELRQSNRTFADENARIAWEVAQEISRIASTIPMEAPRLNARTISFDDEHQARGTYAIFLAGTVIGTANSGQFLVADRSLTILDRLNIPYRITSTPQR